MAVKILDKFQSYLSLSGTDGCWMMVWFKMSKKLFFHHRRQRPQISQNVCPWPSFPAKSNIPVRPGAYPGRGHQLNLTQKYQTMMNSHARGKRSSLFFVLVSDEEKKSFIALTPGFLPSAQPTQSRVRFLKRHNKLDRFSLFRFEKINLLS